MKFLLIVIFILGVYYLIHYRLNLKKAADIAEDAIFPANKSDFSQILIPTEWKEMKPLSKNTSTYKIVKWGTSVVLCIFSVLCIVVLTTDVIDASFLNLLHILSISLIVIRHQGNFYIVSDGLVLDSKYYPSKSVQHYEIEKIIRWHPLYGLNDRLNNSYKLTFKHRKNFLDSTFVVIENEAQLEKIRAYLENLSIPYVETGSPK